MKYSKGFTILELVFVIVICGIASVFFFIQKNDVEAAARDEQRKTTINSLYYSIEEVYFKEHGSYPRVVTSAILPSIDADILKDPQDVQIGDSESDYQYEATDCEADACKHYTLRTTLENEDDFVKESRH